MDWELVKAVPVLVKVLEIQGDVVDESKAEDDGNKKTKTESEKWIEMWTEFGPQTT